MGAPGGRPAASSTSPDVLSGQPDAEDGPADVLDRYEDVTAGPCLRRGLDDLQAVTFPDDPRSDVDRGSGRDLSSAWRDGPSVEDGLFVVLVDVRSQDLLATQVHTEVLIHVEQVYECARPDGQSPGCRQVVTDRHGNVGAQELRRVTTTSHEALLQGSVAPESRNPTPRKVGHTAPRQATQGDSIHAR